MIKTAISKEATLKGDWKITAHEISVNYYGWNYQVIYGSHIGGWFIAIPNWKVCVESSQPWDAYYNAERLESVLTQDGAAKVIAEMISQHWKSIENEVKEK